VNRPPAPSLIWTSPVPDVPGLCDFHTEVIGWTAEPLDMDGYSDFVMKSPGGTPAAGSCRARGENADLPPFWLAYVTVDDLATSVAAVRSRGGDIAAGRTANARACMP
jgi:predicted enzyme related to lactoylglutathione lyase